MYVRLGSGDMAQSLAAVEGAFKKFYLSAIFDYHFLDKNFAAQYDAEKKQGQILLVFTIFTISIACLGLFGLISFTVSQRVKEIGIRKVLGAGVTNITVLLTGGLLKVVLVAMFIAIPVSWMLMNRWLQDFAYRIHMSWWIFITSGIVALVIALITVSFQAIKAAIANPVKSLRTE